MHRREPTSNSASPWSACPPTTRAVSRASVLCVLDPHGNPTSHLVRVRASHRAQLCDREELRRTHRDLLDGGQAEGVTGVLGKQVGAVLRPRPAPLCVCILAWRTRRQRAAAGGHARDPRKYQAVLAADPTQQHSGRQVRQAR